MFAVKSSLLVVVLISSSFALPAPAGNAPGFKLQNGKDAIALNDEFQSLSATSPCTSGQDACIQGQFAQCANGKFVLTSCGAGTTCAALPLVNKPGTSVTCTTEADKNARIAATGASGGSSANAGAANNVASGDPASVAAAPVASSPSSGGGAAPSGVDHLANGKQAQAANAKSATLTPNSPCTDGENACINGEFAQCANSKFVLTPCGGGLQCFALPLLNKPGISNTCVSKAEAEQRIKDSGAGSLTGN